MIAVLLIVGCALLGVLAGGLVVARWPFGDSEGLRDRAGSRSTAAVSGGTAAAAPAALELDEGRVAC